MNLIYPGEWKFDGVGFEVSNEADSEFFEMIKTIAHGNDNQKRIFETFKTAFGVESSSSSTSFAEYDLSVAMGEATSNAALYIASFWDGLVRNK